MSTSKSVRQAYARCLQILLLLLVAGVAQAQSKVEMVASPGSAAPGTAIQVNLSYLTVGRSYQLRLENSNVHQLITTRTAAARYEKLSVSVPNAPAGSYVLRLQHDAFGTVID